MAIEGHIGFYIGLYRVIYGFALGYIGQYRVI